MYGTKFEIYIELYEHSEKAQLTLSKDLSHWILDLSVDEYGHIPYHHVKGETNDDYVRKL